MSVGMHLLIFSYIPGCLQDTGCIKAVNNSLFCNPHGLPLIQNNQVIKSKVVQCLLNIANRPRLSDQQLKTLLIREIGMREPPQIRVCEKFHMELDDERIKFFVKTFDYQKQDSYLCRTPSK